MNENFINVLNVHLDTLRQYVPIVKRVHGSAHPEFIEVANNFVAINEKVNNGNYDLLTEFNNLNKITNNYKIPMDVCESYAHVYNLLKELDDAYRIDLWLRFNVLF